MPAFLCLGIVPPENGPVKGRIGKISAFFKERGRKKRLRGRVSEVGTLHNFNREQNDYGSYTQLPQSFPQKRGKNRDETLFFLEKFPRMYAYKIKGNENWVT